MARSPGLTGTVTLRGQDFGNHDVFFPVIKGEHDTPARLCRKESLQRRRDLDRYTALLISPCLWNNTQVARAARLSVHLSRGVVLFLGNLIARIRF